MADSDQLDPRVFHEYDPKPLMPMEPGTLCPHGTVWELDEDERHWNCVSVTPFQHDKVPPPVGGVGTAEGKAVPPWRESPFGRVVRFLGERPKPPYPKHERCSVGIGISEEWDTELEPGVTRLQVFSRVQEKHGLVIVPHCYRGIRPCWCWPDEVNGYKLESP